jgi:hypothetical protein
MRQSRPGRDVFAPRDAIVGVLHDLGESAGLGVPPELIKLRI